MPGFVKFGGLLDYDRANRCVRVSAYARLPKTVSLPSRLLFYDVKFSVTASALRLLRIQRPRLSQK